MPNLCRGQDLLPSPTLRTPFARDRPSKKPAWGQPGWHTFGASGRFILRSDLARDFPSGSEPPGLAERAKALHKADVSELLPGKKKTWLLLQVCMKNARTKKREGSVVEACKQLNKVVKAARRITGCPPLPPPFPSLLQLHTKAATLITDTSHLFHSLLPPGAGAEDSSTVSTPG